MNDQDLTALHRELFERSHDLATLDAAQIEAWISGMFAAWETEADVVEFVQFCAERGGTTAATLCVGLSALGDEAVRIAAAEVLTRIDDAPLPASLNIGAAQAAQAWTVSAPFGTSVVIGFSTGSTDVIDHCALIEVDRAGVLLDVQMAGPPDELLADELLDEAGVALETLSVEAAFAQIVSGWIEAQAADFEAGPGVAGNQRLLRSRIEKATGQRVPLFVTGMPKTVAEVRGMDPNEIDRANAAATSTLEAAVQVSEASSNSPEAHEAWVAVVAGTLQGLTPRERDGLLWLEWADWLGAGIGLLRAGPATPVDGETLVDHINACPEVSSTIPAGDRDYAIWAFGIAVDHLEDGGLVADGVLTELGFATLRTSMLSAWAS